MPRPSSSLATLRPELGSVMEFDLMASRQGFVGSLVSPMIDVGVQSGTVGIIPLEQLLQDAQNVQRAPGSAYARDDFQFDDWDFATKELAREHPVDDSLAKIYANYFDAESIAAQRAMDKVLRYIEGKVASTVIDATAFASQITSAATAWSSSTSATPVDNVRTATETFRSRCGMLPNLLVMSWGIFRSCQESDQIKDEINSAGAGDASKARDITTAMLAQVFDVDRVVVADGLKNTANRGQSASLSDIWGSTYCALLRAPMTNDIQEPCFCRTLRWGEESGLGDGLIVESYRDETVRGDVIRVRTHLDVANTVVSEMNELIKVTV